MKICPHCKAQIEDNARFCLYCMTSLDEKQEIIVTEKSKKRWPIILAAFLALVLVTASLGVGLKNCGGAEKNEGKKPSKTSATDKTSKPKDNKTDTENTDSSSGEEVQTPDGGSSDGGTQSGTQDGGTQTGGGNNNGTQSGESGGTQSGGTQEGTQGTPDTDSAPDTDTQTPTVTPTPITYTYIEATTENTYPPGMGLSYTPENSIVITKVNTAAADGVYVIPETIDGKKVRAIMAGAFSDPKVSKTVKSVTLPASVKTVWSGAFENCYNLTDLYLKSPVVELYKDSFPEVSKRNFTITIHCKKDCRNFNYYYYSNIANQYSAEYEEWNG